MAFDAPQRCRSIQSAKFEMEKWLEGLGADTYKFLVLHEGPDQSRLAVTYIAGGKEGMFNVWFDERTNRRDTYNPFKSNPWDDGFSDDMLGWD
jgi:hypothetical protein